MQLCEIPAPSLADMAEFEFSIPCSGGGHYEPGNEQHDGGPAKYWIRSICPGEGCDYEGVRAVCEGFVYHLRTHPQFLVYCRRCFWTGPAGEVHAVVSGI